MWFVEFVKLYLDCLWLADEGDAITIPVEGMDTLIITSHLFYRDLFIRYKLVNPWPGVVAFD